MGSYGSDLGHPQTPSTQQHHYVPTNAMWGAGSAPPMYPQHHPQQHGFPSTAASHDLYASSNDWLHAGKKSPLKIFGLNPIYYLLIGLLQVPVV